MDKHMKETIQAMIDKILTDKSRLGSECSGSTYAEGMINALEWALGQYTDEDLLNL